VAARYEAELPRALAAAGYLTAAIGKNHFGWDPEADRGVSHGFHTTSLYDGLGAWDAASPHSWKGEWDDYDRWFARQKPGSDPQATLDDVDGDGWNTWQARRYIYDEALHPTAWVGQQAVRFIQEQPVSPSAGRPFFLKVSFHRPHSPYDPPQRLLDAVRAEELRPVRLCPGAEASRIAPAGGEDWCLQFRGAPGDPPGCGPSSPDAWCGMMPENETTLSRRAYAANVNFVDEWVGHILTALEERRLLERTWILFTSDHGDGQGDMFHWRKGYPYEFSAHVPMVLRWPQEWASRQPPESLRVARGSVVAPPLVAELRDVFHTLADAAGISRNSSLMPPQLFHETDGRSLLCLLRDPTGSRHCDYPPNPGRWRRWIDMEHSTVYNVSNHWSALTDGMSKYVYIAGTGDEQLFNLSEDPYEGVDLSKSAHHQAELALWRGRLASQFEAENRGGAWVKGGALVRRAQGTTYSPNYPGQHSSSGEAARTADQTVLV